MIDPYNITKYNRTQAELEEFLFFCVLVAGKSAKTQVKKLEDFLNILKEFAKDATTVGELIQDYVVKYGMPSLMSQCHEVKTGKYKMMRKFFYHITYKGFPDLNSCSTQDLESIPGVGLKSSRFFIVHSRANVRHSILDTHILKWLSSLGYRVPPQTPSYISKYLEIEQLFLNEYDKNNRGLTLAQFDLELWKHYAIRTT